MKRVLSFTFGIVLLMVGVCYAQSAPKVGYLDIQRVIRDSKAGRRAKDAFERDFNKRKAIIDQKQAAVDKLKKQFFSKEGIMDNESRKRLAEDIEKKEKELKRMRADFREELQKKDFELTEKILRDVEKVLKKYGDDKGYTIVLEKTEGGVVYGSKEADITDDIIKEYDSKK
ncbi:MAG: OmpH family outer membrane protein [Candidatus Dadabacteria bacterium]|nr:OmpH family outer membrane protein [Candidatus Dadabacteria bacterium]